MKIQVNTDGSIAGSDALTQQLEADVSAALERYGDRLTRVELHLSDENGPKASHGADKRCMIEARPAGLQPVAVTEHADTIERACHGTTRKLQSLLDTTFGRIADRHGDDTIRQAEDS